MKKKKEKEEGEEEEQKNECFIEIFMPLNEVERMTSLVVSNKFFLRILCT